MEGKRFIHNITLKNILSYGSEGVSIDLQPLNVIIGTNASGKSNLIEAIGLLQAAPNGLSVPIALGGGIEQWLWKGNPPAKTAELEAVVRIFENKFVKYSVDFGPTEDSWFHIFNETIVDAKKTSNGNKGSLHQTIPYYHNGKITAARGSEREIINVNNTGELDPFQSILAQRRDASFYPEITELAKQLPRIKIYRQWSFEVGKPPRTPEPFDVKPTFLTEDNSNLVSLLYDLFSHTDFYNNFLEQLQALYPEAEAIKIETYSASRELFVREYNLANLVSAARLSDGVLRYITLLAILLHPDPPPLICLDEPEIGIHPDLINNLADLLIAATKKTQLIITTQSDMLLSALSRVPESVIVCERDEQGSHLRRLDTQQLEEWLRAEPLGGLWARGLLGASRW